LPQKTQRRNKGAVSGVDVDADVDFHPYHAVPDRKFPTKLSPVLLRVSAQVANSLRGVRNFLIANGLKPFPVVFGLYPQLLLALDPIVGLGLLSHLLRQREPEWFEFRRFATFLYDLPLPAFHHDLS
jgi:hypothetical protein